MARVNRLLTALVFCLAACPRASSGAVPCEVSSSYSNIPAFASFEPQLLEEPLCNRLVNTLLTVEWMLPSAANDSQRAEMIGNLARRLHAYGYLDQARDLYVESSRLTPLGFRFPFMLGLIEEAEGNLGAALAFAQAASELEPRHPPLIAFLARLLFRTGEYDAAVAAAQAALSLDQDLGYSWWTLAEVAAARNDPEGVLRYAAEALDRAPEANLLHQLRADALTELARHEESAEAASRAGLQGPELSGPWVDSVRLLTFEPLSHTRFGRVALRRRQVDVAQRAFDRALVQNPSDVDALLGLGRTQRLLGKTDEAVSLLRSAAAEDDRLEIWLELGRILQEEADLAGAIEAYRGALKHTPDHKMARFWTAECLYQEGELESALTVLLALIEGGFGPQGYLLTADVLIDSDRDGEAREVLEQGLKRYSTDRGLARTLARLLATSRDMEARDAGIAVRLARQLTKDQASALDYALLVRALESSGDHTAAQQALRTALERLPAEDFANSLELQELREAFEPDS